jgi:predicted amidohydrolase
MDCGVARSLATAQTIPVRGNVPANVEQHLRLVRLAAAEQPQVLVFPELSLTGYELDCARELAFSENDARLGPLIEAASAHALTLVVGAPIRIATRLHIGAFILFPDRTIAVHTKSYLGAFSSDVNPAGTVPPAEDTVFEAGMLCPLLPLGDEPAAVAICAESLRRAHARKVAELGARTYLSSHFGIPADLEYRIATLRAHAIAHHMAVAFANYAGSTGGLRASGGSAVLSQAGELLVQLDSSSAGIAVAIEDETGWRAKACMLD